MRANAFSAFGALSKYATGGQREGFVEQVTHYPFRFLFSDMYDEKRSCISLYIKLTGWICLMSDSFHPSPLGSTPP